MDETELLAALLVAQRTIFALLTIIICELFLILAVTA